MPSWQEQPGRPRWGQWGARIVLPVFVCAGLVVAFSLLNLTGCERAPQDATSTLTVTLGRIKTLDPALADDAASATAVGHLYDRLLQYDYVARPYRLAPAMITEMPTFSADGRTITFTLRRGLRFSPDPCFPGEAGREVRPRDVIWSLLRLADGRLHAGGYWILRGRLVGLDAFNRETAGQPPGDWSAYEKGIPGLHEAPGNRIVFTLTEPYPQLLDVLAMPYASVMPAAAIRQYSPAELGGHAVGSGPFRLAAWRRNYRFSLARNPEFRPEAYEGEKLPRVERVDALIVQEPVTAWLLFLQGNLDIIGLGQEQLGQVLGSDGALAPVLAERGLRLSRQEELQINYIGFNARDPLLGSNLKLRQAISLAFNRTLRLQLDNRRLIPAQGPIPPGVSGYDPDFRNPFCRYDLAEAKRLLAAAGFAGGVDPATGSPLRLRFDLGRTDLDSRQQAELLVHDLRQVGIELEVSLNNAPRFFEKLRRGDVQLFRLNWVGDYPDAQNFLQLFYGANADGCNRAAYQNPDFDRLYLAAVQMPDGAERTARYQALQQLLAQECPWIFEGYPVAYKLAHSWVRGYIPHHFACDRWKYVGIDVPARQAWIRDFKPFTFRPSSTSVEPP